MAYHGDTAKMEADLNAIYQQYKDAYGKEQGDAIYTEELIAHVAGDLLSDTDAISRIVADKPSAARRMLDTIRNFINRIKGVNDPFVDQLRKVEKLMTKALDEGQKGSGTKFSLRQTNDGTKYVEVDTDQDIFDGHALSEYGKIARKYIRDNFEGKVIGNRDSKALVYGKTASEYAYPAKRLGGNVYEGKMRASTELENLLDASTYVEHADDDGRHKKFPMDSITITPFFPFPGRCLKDLLT